MSLVKLLPKSFLDLGTNYGIDYLTCTFQVTKLETHSWNSAFSFCVITDTGSGEWQDIARAAHGDFGNRRFVAAYLNPPVPGKTGFCKAKVKVRGFYQRQHRLPKTQR